MRANEARQHARTRIVADRMQRHHPIGHGFHHSAVYPHRYHDVARPNIVNTPLAAGTGSAAFRAAIERGWGPALAAHRPDLVLLSAGFDAHRDDPLAELDLDEEDYRWVTAFAVEAAERHAGGRVVSTLEGGYDLAALARSVAAHLQALA
jgi:acetoin utilization deacetylase AcuC-like enzyme